MDANIDLYVSSKLRRNLADNSDRVAIGAAHYSYSLVAEKFKRLLRLIGQTPYELDRPEIYAEPPLRTGRPAVHLMFKPFDEFRVLHSAFNIAQLFWEFERLPTRSDWKVGDPRRGYPLADYVQMLQVPDRLWVGCSFTQEIFRRYGIGHVDVVPTPIAVVYQSASDLLRAREFGGSVARREMRHITAIRLDRQIMTSCDPDRMLENRVDLASIIRPGRTLFLSIATPGDLRKNLPALIDGFAVANHRDDSSALIIKLIIDNKTTTIEGVIATILPMRYREQERDFGDISTTNIYLVHDFLPQEMLVALYTCCDFYISASCAEGQNLPLQEAMAEGAIPIVATHTAMADYVSEENGIVLQWRDELAPHSFERAYGLQNLPLARIAAEDVAAGIEKAKALDRIGIMDKRVAAWKVIRERYAEQVVGQTVARLLACYVEGGVE